MDFSYDVIIPAYNAATTLSRAIDSALAQTLPPSAVVVVDDGSRDETPQIAERYGPPVKLIRQANAGPGAARNRGAESTSASWIALLDADDEWLPRKLEAQAAAASDPKVGLICCPTAESQGQEFPEPCDLRALWRGNALGLSSAVVRRSAFAEVGGFSEERVLDPVADYHLWLRLAAKGWRVVEVNEPLLIYYAHTPGNLTKQVRRFFEGALACARQLGPQFGMSRREVDEKVREIRRYYGRRALYLRDMKMARALLGRDLLSGPAPERLAWFLVSCAPAGLLNLRRRLIGQSDQEAVPSRPGVLELTQKGTG